MRCALIFRRSGKLFRLPKCSPSPPPPPPPLLIIALRSVRRGPLHDEVAIDDLDYVVVNVSDLLL